MDTIEALVSAEVARADVIDGAEVVALIDEQVLYRLIGSSKVMRDQLLHVADLADRPNLCVQIVQTSVGATAGLGGDINLATTDGVPDVLHTDAVPEGHTTETRSLVRRATIAFERIRGYALPRAESKDFIMKVADERWNQ